MKQPGMCLSILGFPVLLTLFLLQGLTGYAQYRLNVEGDIQVLGRIQLGSAGTHNAFVGFGAGGANTSGGNNAIFGYRAGFLNTSGSDNTYVGYEAGRNNVSGFRNSAIGFFALSSNQVNSKNTAIGARALLFFQEGYGFDPTAGNQDLGTTYNLALGTSAGLFTNDPTGAGAERNTFVGNNSGLFNTTGYRNAFMGFQAGDTNTTGDYNTCIGHEADLSSNSFFNAGAFGNLAVVNASNKIRMGDGAVATVEGNGWSLPSDGRFKKNIQENVPGLDFIMKLRPVTYQFDVMKFNAHIRPAGEQDLRAKDPKNGEREAEYRRASTIVQTGFIAQEVEKAAQEKGFDFSGIVKPTNPRDNYGLSYSLFVVPVVKGMQEQQQQIGELKQENRALADKNKSLEDRITRLETLMAQLTGNDSGNIDPGQKISLSDVRLFQNRPNPFSQRTLITYFIPETVREATLEILSPNGKRIKNIRVESRGEGTTTLEASALPAGNYVYRLMADGKLVDSKVMVLTN